MSDCEALYFLLFTFYFKETRPVFTYDPARSVNVWLAAPTHIPAKIAINPPDPRIEFEYVRSSLHTRANSQMPGTLPPEYEA